MSSLFRVLSLGILRLPLLVIIVKHGLLGWYKWLLHPEMLAHELGKWTDRVLSWIFTDVNKRKITYLMVGFAIGSCSTSKASTTRFAKVF